MAAGALLLPPPPQPIMRDIAAIDTADNLKILVLIFITFFLEIDQ
jgi:hypothetical protein